MKIGCNCGELIYDGSDNLSYKAHLISDMDSEDLLESIRAFRIAPNEALRQHVAAVAYQCTECGRLAIDRDGVISWFAPEQGKESLLHSAKGEGWPRPLDAKWRNGKGEIFWGSTGLPNGDNGYITDIGSWEELEALYHSTFARLRAKGCLRSSCLSKGADLIHEWP